MGTQAHVITNHEGKAHMTFTADAVGNGLIGVTVTGTELPTAYSVFQIVEPPRAPASKPAGRPETTREKPQKIESIKP